MATDGEQLGIGGNGHGLVTAGHNGVRVVRQANVANLRSLSDFRDANGLASINGYDFFPVWEKDTTDYFFLSSVNLNRKPFRFPRIRCPGGSLSDAVLGKPKCHEYDYTENEQ